MQGPRCHSKWVIQFQPVVWVILWCHCTAINVVCWVRVYVKICVGSILDVHIYVRVYCFTFYTFFLSCKVNWVVQLFCSNILHYIHTGLLTTNTAASLKQLGVQFLTQVPLDSDCCELLLHFPGTHFLSQSRNYNWQPCGQIFSKCMCLWTVMCLCDSLSIASELKVSAVSRDKQSTVTSPPWMRYQLCLRGVVPSNLSWKPVLELSFIPIKTSSKAHWAECFPTRMERKK